MKFSKTDKGVSSDAGFTLCELDAEHIRYTAPRLSLTIPVEKRSDAEMFVRLGGLQAWDPPNHAEPLTTEDKQRLKLFLTAGMRFAGIEVEFDI